MVAEPFIWGRAGAKLTSDQIAKEREMAEALAKGAMDYSPVGHWSQGLGRVAQGLLAGLDYRNADAAEADNATYNQGIIESLLGGAGGSPSSPVAAASMPAMTGAGQEMAATSPAAPAVDISGDQQTFIQSLLPAAIEESKRTGVDPRIIVAQAAQETGWGKSAPGNNFFGIKSHGQGGGNSLMTTEYVGGQPVKMRDSFRAYGSPAESVRGYGDFILQNPRYEGLRTAKGIDAQLEALQASGYATDPNYSRNVGAIARGIQLPQEVAAATPQAAIEAVAPASGYVDPMVSSQPEAPALPPPTEISSPPSVAAVPQQQVAQALSPPTNAAPQAQGINPAILRALSDPRAAPQTRAVAQALMQQEMRKQEAQQEIQLKQADPRYQQQLQLGQIELEQARQPKRQALMNAGDGRLYDPNNGSWIEAPNSTKPGFRQANADEIKQYGTNGQVGPDGRFYPVTPPQGTALSVDPATGAVTFNQGPGVKPLTEAQSKDSFFTTRMTAATPTIDKFESALMSLPEAVAGAIPLNLGRYAQSEEYQLAKDAGKDFVNAYLRKDSGAALTPAEEANYGQLLLPQPGDKPAIIAAKRQRRLIAVEAIKSGMPPSAVDGVLRAIQAVPGADQPMQTTKEKKAVINGYQIEELPE